MKAQPQVRTRIVEYARAVLQERAPGDRPVADKEAVAFAADKSSFFSGFWRFFDTELRVAVVPVEKWVDGDARPFLNAFPFMVLQVLAAGKPQTKKFMLLQLERLLYYKLHHPDFLKTFCLNVGHMDEEDIELLNAPPRPLRQRAPGARHQRLRLSEV